MKEVNLNTRRNIAFRTAQMPQNQIEQSHFNEQNYSQETLPEIQLPDLYQNSSKNFDKKTLKEKIKQWDMMNIVYPWLAHPFLMLGTCGAMALGVDKFAEACGGEYNKSLVGKAANLGDRITESAFVKSKPVQGIIKAFNATTNKIGKIFKNSDIINAIRKTPSQPEWAMPKDELLSMGQRIVRDFSEVANALKITEEGAVAFEQLHIGKEEKEFLKKFFGAEKVSNEVKASAIQLKNLGFADDAIKNAISNGNTTSLIKTETIKKLGLTPEKIGMDLKTYFEKLAKGNITKEDINLIKEACKNGRNIKITDGYKKWLGPLQIFKRKIGLDETANRLVSLTEAKTKLGRSLASFLQKCHRGFTFGGGKMMVLFFVTPFLVDSIIDVTKAEKKEKVGTAAHGLVHSMSWVFTFPLAIKIMHHLGGVQYAGMSPEKVSQYREAIKVFNKKVADGVFTNHDAYKAELKKLQGELKTLKAVKGQNLLTKITKKLGSFMTMDLETIAPYRGSNPLMNTARKIPNFLKNLGGVPMRLAIWGGISMGVLDSIINKCIKVMFGNYYDRMKFEEFEANKKQQKEYTKEDLRARLVETQREKLYGKPQNEKELNNNTEIDTSLLKKNLETQKESKEINAVSEEEAIKNDLKKTPEEDLSQEKIKQDEKSISIVPTAIEPKEINNYTIKPNGEIQKEELSPLAETNIPVKEEVMPTQDNEAEQLIEKDKYSYIPLQKEIMKNNLVKKDNYTYIPSSENIIKQEKSKTEINKYIPSQLGAKFTKTFDNSALDSTLRRADRAEQRAFQVLAGNFNGF